MEKRKAFLLRLAYWGAIMGLVWLAARCLLPWTLPFLLALGLAALMEPALEKLRQKARLKRSFLAAVFTLLLLAVLLALVFTLVSALLRQAEDVLRQLPLYLTGLPDLLRGILARLESFCAACPAGLRQAAERLLAELPQYLTRWVGTLSDGGLRLAAGWVAALPAAVLFCATTALAVFFSLSTYPSIAAFLRRQLPPEGQAWVRGLRDSIFSTLGKWLKAQCVLLSITFAQLLAGFTLLRQPYALLLAFTVALIDALPVFGTGTVLLPWAGVLLLAGNVPRGLALAALYAVIAVVRSVTEPKIMAAQAGLPPLLALMAMYVGFRTVGVGGMVLLPIALLLVKQLHDSGYLKIWK